MLPTVCYLFCWIDERDFWVVQAVYTFLAREGIAQEMLKKKVEWVQKGGTKNERSKRWKSRRIQKKKIKKCKLICICAETFRTDPGVCMSIFVWLCVMVIEMIS